MLYTLMNSPWQCDIETLLLLLRPEDDLLLLQGGVPGRCRARKCWPGPAPHRPRYGCLKRMLSHADYLLKFQPVLPVWTILDSLR